MAGLDTRNPDVARRMGWSQGAVAEVRRLFGEVGASRTATVVRVNPWLSQASRVRAGGYDAAIELARAVARRALRDTPVGEVADLALGAVAIARMHPLMRVLQTGLLLRELALQRAGDPAVGGPAGVFTAGGNVWQFGANWELALQCEGGAQGPFYDLVNGGGCQGESLTWYQLYPPPSLQEGVNAAGELATGTIASFGSARDSPIPNYVITTQNEAWVYTGPTVPAPAAAEMPVAVPAFWPGVAGRGLNWPFSPSARLADEAQALSLPGIPLPMREPSPATWEAVHAVREALGLREDIELAPAVAVAPASETSAFSQALPGVAVETQGGVWYPSEPHVYARELGGRTKKLKFTGGVHAARALVMGILTETNDAVNAVWKTLPRGCRKAGLTRTGNRRFDSMLHDINRCWRQIDWDRALGNLVANELEDALLGAQQRFLNKGSIQSGYGLGTNFQRWTQGAGVDTNWTDSITEPVGDYVTRLGRLTGFGGTVSRGLDTLAYRVKRVRDGLS